MRDRTDATIYICCRLRLLKLLIFQFLACVSVHAIAANLCVVAGDYSGLQAALDVAAHNNEDDVLMLQSGYYDFPPNVDITYYPSDQHSLTVAGGYTEFENDPCGGIVSNDARQTTIHGGSTVHLYLPIGAGSIEVRTLTFANVFDATSATAVSIAGGPTTTGSVLVSNVIFAGNVSMAEPAIFLSSANSVVIENSLFYENGTLSGWPSVKVDIYRPDDGLCTEIVHSTFARNTSSSPSLSIANDTCRSLLVNDVFWGNAGGGDVELNSGGYAWNLDIQHPSNLANATSSDLLSLDPQFNPDYSLSDFSPLRDAGLVGVFFANGNFDVFGDPRISNSAPDIGAVEIVDVIFAHAFDW